MSGLSEYLLRNICNNSNIDKLQGFLGNQCGLPKKLPGPGVSIKYTKSLLESMRFVGVPGRCRTLWNFCQRMDHPVSTYTETIVGTGELRMCQVTCAVLDVLMSITSKTSDKAYGHAALLVYHQLKKRCRFARRMANSVGRPEQPKDEADQMASPLTAAEHFKEQNNKPVKTVFVKISKL